MTAGIIPARGGSKGIPGKNIKPIAGFPLIYWTIEAAKQSKYLDCFYVSTDDEKIAAIARSYGAPVLMRPPELAEDDTTTLEVLRHIIQEIECVSVMVLQPTSPLRDEGMIDACISEYRQGGFDTLATGFYTKILEYGTHSNKRRQDIEGFFYDDGNIYIIDKNVIASGNWSGSRICRKVLPHELNLEIDDATDFFIVEQLLKKRLAESRQISDFHQKLKKIKLFVSDVDGVLTDAGMYYSENGDELKKFNTRDGMGFERLRKAGIKTAIITSENTKIVERRAEKLKIDYLFQGIKDKTAVLREILDKENITFEETAYIGDDINDEAVLKHAGIAVTTADGAPECKAAAHYITQKKGGEGAVREIADLIIQR